jgi:hypothetical protein
MKKHIIRIIILLLVVKQSLAQQMHFIYFQNESRTPFFAKLNNKNYSSTSIGYLIISKLENGTYTISIGYPKSDAPLQDYVLTVKDNEQGYLIKDFGDKGYALFNLNTFALQYAGQAVKEQNQLAANAAAEKKRIDSLDADARAKAAALATAAINAKNDTATTTPIAAATTKIETIEATSKTNDSVITVPVAAPIAAPIAIKDTVVKIPEVAKVPIQADTTLVLTKAENIVAKPVVDTVQFLNMDFKQDTARQTELIVPVFKNTVPTDTIVAITKLPTDSIKTPTIIIEKTDSVKAPIVTPVLIDSVKTTKIEPPVVEKKVEPIVAPIEEKKDTVATKIEPPVVEKKVEPIVAPIVEKKEEIKPKIETPVVEKKVEPVAVVAPVVEKKEDIKPKIETPVVEKPATVNQAQLPNSNCKLQAEEKDFFALRKKMVADDDTDNMILIAKKAMKEKCYTTQQIRFLSGLFLTDADRYQFFDAVYPFAYDAYLYDSLSDMLKDTYYLQRFKAMIRK